MSDAYVLAVSLQPHDATTTLFFEHLRQRSTAPIRVASPRDPGIAQSIADAAVVVLVRALFECAEVGWSARMAGVPCYYFTDDNFMVLREQGGESAKYVQGYSLGAVRSALEGLDGVLVATRPLLAFFTQASLHDRVMCVSPTLVPGAPLSKAPSARLRFAFFGGGHLHAKLLSRVLPAVRRLAEQTPASLILMGVQTPVPESPGLTVIQPPYEPSYSRGLATLARAGVDVLIHPVADDMANNAYKNPHALITAHALGAAVIASNKPPYAELREADVCLLADDTDSSWQQAVDACASGDQRAALVARMSGYCERQFDGRMNIAVFDRLLAGATPPGRRRVPAWVTRSTFAAASAAFAASRRARKAWQALRSA